MLTRVENLPEITNSEIDLTFEGGCDNEISGNVQFVQSTLPFEAVEKGKNNTHDVRDNSQVMICKRYVGS